MQVDAETINIIMSGNHFKVRRKTGMNIEKYKKMGRKILTWVSFKIAVVFFEISELRHSSRISATLVRI